MQSLLALFVSSIFFSLVNAQATPIVSPAISNTTLATIIGSAPPSTARPSLIASNIPLSNLSSSVATPSGVAAPNGRPIITYMALGDSFSAGNGAGKLVSPDQPACDRTDGSYVYHLLNDPEVFCRNDPFYPPSFYGEFEFNACSGAVTTGIQSLQMQTAVAPYNHFIAGADLYTMTAGGNDMGFDKIVKACVYSIVIPFAGTCTKLLNAIDDYLAPGSTFQNNLASLYDNLQTQAGPGATVVILPYITFYNDQVSRGPGCWVSQSTRQRMNQQVTNVNAALRAAADARAFQFLDETDLQNAFNGHRFCGSGTKWIQDNIFESLNPTAQAQLNANGTLSPADQNAIANGTSNFWNTGIFHPTAEGHTAYYQLTKALLNPAANVVSDTKATS
ncbi:hypothetical protein OEA41_003455 [Lepraria neglecta]|uniref:SGNH hydrolase-type esterase domain-containing protein n=1 Tax=Lepraria neglecta TaxID=209136 RepID=A0AAE0DJ08_9LECA|nr:hypothetical protein OEA41_003455 [Lepraria neglecta]